MRNAIGARKRGGRQVAQATSIPPFTAGVNAQAALSQMAPGESIFSYNILPSEQGMRTREGSEEWGNGMNGGVKTVISYYSTDWTNKIFACDDDGIWDVTTQGAGSKVFNFTSPGTSAGRGVYTQFTNDSGASFILYADEVHGLIEYDVASDTWQIPTGITGVTLANIRFVAIHKQRVWFCTNESNIGYYLPIAQKAGAATAFYFGNQFPAGGAIVGFYTWTYDGGGGEDDALVVIGRGGDVLIWKGADPSSASTWELLGSWNVGPIPRGRRICKAHGGECYILSTMGVVSLHALVAGKDVDDTGSLVTAKISSLIRARMKTEANVDGWEISVYAAESQFIISTPIRPGSADKYLQYVFQFVINAWGFWRGLPIVSLEDYESKIFFGDEDGLVWTLSDGTDNRKIADTGGDDVLGIDFSVLGSYQVYEAPALHKIGAFVRPTFQGEGPLSYGCELLFDYDLTELGAVSVNTEAGQSLWDTDVWDTAVWADTQNAEYKTLGASGIGRAIAVGVRGTASTRVRLLAVDLSWMQGGFL